MDRFKRQAWYSWAFIGALAGLSVLLAVLQYRWIGEVSRAEQDRLKTNLHATLERLGNEFNDNIAQSANALALHGGEIPEAAAEREAAYLQNFKHWRDTSHQERLFASIIRIVPNKEPRLFDQQRLTFRTVDWPANWSALHTEIQKEIDSGDDGPRHPPDTGDLDVILIPVFPETKEGALPLEWLALEIDLNYVRTAMMPDLMERLTRAVGTGYDAELVSRHDVTNVIFHSDANNPERIGAAADAQVGLLNPQPRPPNHVDYQGLRRTPRLEGNWLLSVRHQAGSLDAVVARTRLKNIAVTTAVLALMLLTIAALVRFTRRAQALSQLQMQFVAGVSHELRTPLTVIRTASHNLSTGIVKPGDVNRYGQLISGQTDKLTALVEQVLRFANAESGRVISRREQVSIESLVEQSLADCKLAITESRCVVESNITPGVPPLFGDPMALRHALQNLLANAAKYGADGQWIGVSAALVNGPRQKPLVEIRVADRGAGIPAEEQAQIFEPFFRGRRALDDQIHGTGLGLALVKRIVEAHGGTIVVGPGADQRGTAFTIRIPPAPPEQIDEFADITS